MILTYSTSHAHAPIYRTFRKWSAYDMPVVMALRRLFECHLKLPVKDPEDLFRLLKFTNGMLLIWSSSQILPALKFHRRMRDLNDFLDTLHHFPNNIYMVELNRKLTFDKNYWATVSDNSISEGGALNTIGSYSGDVKKEMLQNIIGGTSFQIVN